MSIEHTTKWRLERVQRTYHEEYSVASRFRSYVASDFLKVQRRDSNEKVSLYVDHSYVLTCVNVGKPNWSSGREIKVRLCLFTFSIQREIRHFHVVIVNKRQRNVKKKKMWCTCKVVVLLIRPIAFVFVSVVVAVLLLLFFFILTFSLPSHLGLGFFSESSSKLISCSCYRRVFKSRSP